MVNIVGRQRQYKLDNILLPFECMTSLGERVAGSLWPLCLLLFMQSSNKSTTVPIMIIAWFTGTKQRHTEKYHLVIFACKLLQTSIWEQGTLHLPQKMPWPEKLICFITMAVSYALLSLQYTLQIFTLKKASGKESLCSISVCYMGSICSKRILTNSCSCSTWIMSMPEILNTG